MTDTIAVPRLEPVNRDRGLLRIVPVVLLLAVVAYGSRTNLGELRKQGLRPFAVGATGEVVLAAFTFGLVLGTERLLHF